MAQATLLHKLASLLGDAYIRFFGWTSFEIKDDSPAYAALRRDRKKAIYGFWHNKQVVLAYAHRGEPVHVVVSQSKDGEYIAQVMKRLGIPAVRGSSSRGGAQALNDIFDLLEREQPVAFSPDGPRGPVQSVQPGILIAAQKSNAAVIPTAAASRRKIVFNSWDRFELPLPFGVNVLAHGTPFNLSDGQPEETAREKIRSALNAATDVANQTLRDTPSWFSLAWGGVVHAAANCLFLLAGPVLLPFLAVKFGFRRSVADWKDRIGLAGVPAPAKKRIWTHSASIGEWRALKPLLAELKKTDGVEFFMTVSSPEAKALIQKEEPSLPVRLLPLDAPFLMARFVRRVRPFAALVVETELWPNFLRSLYNTNVPVFLVNGRLSARSLRGWRFFKPFFNRLTQAFSVLFVRTPEDADRFAALGARASKIRVSGNLKVDNLRVRQEGERDDLRGRHFGNRDGFVFVAGSTWPGEETLILSAWTALPDKNARLVLAPRRLRRCDEIGALVEKSGLSWTRWSRAKKDGAWTTGVLLVDTLGDLDLLYRTSDAAFVGGSLVPRGGQNPLEPAAAGIPVFFGPSMDNFSAEKEALLSSGAAAQLSSAEDLTRELRLVKEDSALRERRGRAARQCVMDCQGVSVRVAGEIKDLLNL